jgi:hypothetical protein
MSESATPASADEPPAELDDTPPSDGDSPSRSRWRLWVGLAVGVLVLVVIVALVARPDDPTYDDASRERFLSACTADAGEPVQSTCECLYDRIVATVPFDRFELISEDLEREAQGLPADEPLPLPDDVQAMLDECVAAAAPASN